MYTHTSKALKIPVSLLKAILEEAESSTGGEKQ
jgi:hypothetical protein